MILKGAANFLLLLMQDLSVASVNRMLKQRRRERERQRINRGRLEKQQQLCSTLF